MRVGSAFGLELGLQRLGDIPYGASSRQELNVGGGIPKDYYLYGFIARLRGRLGITGGTANGTVVAEAGRNLVEQFEVSGNHSAFGDYTRLLLQGSHCFELARTYDNFDYENSSTPAFSGAIGNYDFNVTYFIPFTPPKVRKEEQLFYLFDAPRWTTSQLYADWGAPASLISGGDRTLALTAFGSGSGTPQLRIWRVIAKLGNAKKALNPIPIKQSYKPVLTSISEATANDVDIFDIKSGNWLRHIMVVQGARATGGSAATKGINFLTLSDSVVSRLKLKKDDVPIRDIDQVPLQQWFASRKQQPFAPRSGYSLFDFCDDDTVGTAFDSVSIAKENLRFTLAGDTAGTTNDRIQVVTYELTALPVFN